MEIKSKLFGVAHVRHLAVLEEPVRGEQVSFHQRAVQRIAVPFRRSETFVAANRRLPDTAPATRAGTALPTVPPYRSQTASNCSRSSAIRRRQGRASRRSRRHWCQRDVCVCDSEPLGSLPCRGVSPVDRVFAAY